MPKWNTFTPLQFEYDFDNDKLHNHDLTIEEAVQCFSHKYKIRKNKKYLDRFKLIGKTDSGRSICLIFQLKKGNIVRIITGWEIKNGQD